MAQEYPSTGRDQGKIPFVMRTRERTRGAGMVLLIGCQLPAVWFTNVGLSEPQRRKEMEGYPLDQSGRGGHLRFPPAPTRERANNPLPNHRPAKGRQTRMDAMLMR